MPDYKAAKQAFVADNRGSGVLHIQAVTQVGWTSYILYAALVRPGVRAHPSPVQEYLAVFLPLLLAQTVCAQHPYLFNFGIILLSLALRARNTWHREPTSQTEAVGSASAQPAPRAGHKPFLTTWRSHMMCMTVIAILAVDFPIFPREFGKTEDWGTSLMDVGVGSFVFSQGLVSASAVLKSRATSGNAQPYLPLLARTVKKCLPVIALGMVRVIMVKGVDYPEHITEYGVHWNFFFTLAAMPILSILLLPLRTFIPNTLLIAGIMGGQTWALHAGMEKWVMAPDNGSRRGTGLLHMNKEGIASLPGYLAIYLIGTLVGEFVLQTPSPKNERGKKDHHRITRELGMYAFYSWTTFFILRQAMHVPVSRRMANAPYVAWTSAYNSTFLLGYHLIEQYVFMHGVEPGRKVPSLLEAINKNGLAIFLIANLLTGLINISLQTMYAPDLVAFSVLVAYTSVLSVGAWLLRGARLTL